MNLLKMVDMQQIDVIIKRHKCVWMGHSLRIDESGTTNEYGILRMVLGEERADPARRGDELWKGTARI